MHYEITEQQIDVTQADDTWRRFATRAILFVVCDCGARLEVGFWRPTTCPHCKRQIAGIERAEIAQ